MITYKKLKVHPILFNQLTGLNVIEFDELVQKLEPLWLRENYYRLDRPDRKRCVGGGPSYKLKLTERLLMTVILLHTSPNTNALSFLFEVNKSTVSRNTRNILPILYELDSNWPSPPQRHRGKPIKQILKIYPELSELVHISDA